METSGSDWTMISGRVEAWFSAPGTRCLGSTASDASQQRAVRDGRHLATASRWFGVTPGQAVSQHLSETDDRGFGVAERPTPPP